MDLSSKPLAIAVGYRDNILNKYGYGLVDTALIFEDIIYDNKNFLLKKCVLCDSNLYLAICLCLYINILKKQITH